MDIDGVSLLDKRGYLTICISQLREGRIYLRKQEGIRDWFNIVQVNMSVFYPQHIYNSAKKISTMQVFEYEKSHSIKLNMPPCHKTHFVSYPAIITTNQ